MAPVAIIYGLHFNQPWMLLAALLVVPIVWLGRRNLAQLGRVRRFLAITMRVLVVLVLAALLARPTVSREHERLTVIAVMDRSRSVPEEMKLAAMAYLEEAVKAKPPEDSVALVNVAEKAVISSLPTTSTKFQKREVNLTGMQSRLADGLQLGMAVAPPETATRMLLISDGNETAGDLLEVARVAAANRIPVDVRPLPYEHPNEVIVRRLAAPPTARARDSIPLRFVLSSTGATQGELVLRQGAKVIGVTPVTLKKGTNVLAVSVPIGTAGTYRFTGTFIPGTDAHDTVKENNSATAVTHVAGPGHVLVVDGDGKSATALTQALANAGIDARPISPAAFPTDLGDLLSTDAVMMVNTPNSFTVTQQDMMVRYVNDLGRGLVMVGGTESFGAGGWIGSPVAEILPVDLDPPQKKEMPRGALVMVMHACEFARGNYWGKRVAIAASKTLSSQDYVGVIDYSWQGGAANWVYKLQLAGNKKGVISAINKMEMGDMMDLGPPIKTAYAALKKVNAGQKHMIIISDGDPSPPSRALMKKIKDSGITITCVCVFPHGGQVPAGYYGIYRYFKDVGGNWYRPNDPSKLPQIFVKEAMMVRRSLIVEGKFTPAISAPTNDAISGFRGFPELTGYILTGRRGGLATTVLMAGDDPLLAVRQSGLGRTAAFTSAADSKWAAQWIAWGGFERFWKQMVAQASRSRSQGDCQVYADVQGRRVTLTVEAVDVKGQFVQYAALQGNLVTPEMKIKPMELKQVGPGRYRAQFEADDSGSYLVNLRYRKAGADGASGSVQTVVTVPYAPEFRDLRDNSALLRAVAAETGGRVLPAKASDAKLFDRTAMAMPTTFLPLTTPLLIIWLALFLIDVAVRRISIDVAAGWRWVTNLPKLMRGSKGKAGATLTQLQSVSQRVRGRLKRSKAAGDAEPQAGERYHGGDAAGGEAPPPLPMADVDKARQDAPAPAEPAKEEPEPAPKPEGPDHLQRLLRAKRRASDDKKKR